MLPRFSKVSVVAQWSAITLGAFGITIKPKVFQIKIHGSDRPRTDKSLFESDEEEEIEEEFEEEIEGYDTVY